MLMYLTNYGFYKFGCEVSKRATFDEKLNINECVLLVDNFHIRFDSNGNQNGRHFNSAIIFSVKNVCVGQKMAEKMLVGLYDSTSPRSSSAIL